jgi:hypothetical protein
MSRSRRWLTIGVAGGLVLGLAVYLGSGALAPNEWACDPDRLATDVIDVAEGGGYPSEMEALEAEAKLLALDGVADAGQLLEALGSGSGEDRFESGAGNLILDGEKVAEVNTVRLADGTWTISGARYCSPDPS